MSWNYSTKCKKPRNISCQKKWRIKQNKSYFVKLISCTQTLKLDVSS